MEIIRATDTDVKELATIFNAYRIFYKQPSDLAGAEVFLSARLMKQDSIIYCAKTHGIIIGFVQLYPLFSSVTMQPMLLLNDLYVQENYRNRSVGTRLIDAAKTLCRETNQKGLALETEKSNRAQELYGRLGFRKGTNLHMFWTNNNG